MPSTDVEELKIKAVGIGNPPMVVGISFNVPIPLEQRREFIRVLAENVEKGMVDIAGFDPDVFMTVSLDAVFGCGGQATYRTAEEVPLVNVPCPCGDPNHWLIRWRDELPPVLGGEGC